MLGKLNNISLNTPSSQSKGIAEVDTHSPQSPLQLILLERHIDIQQRYISALTNWANHVSLDFIYTTYKSWPTPGYQP